MSAGRNAISEKKDWNTPPKYVQLIEKLFIEVDLDPCSNIFSLVNANVKYILPVDGLKESWDYKRIYVNPPYGRDIKNKTTIYDWLKKGLESNKIGNELLFLIPVATNTKHFKEIIFKFAAGICFLKDTRLKFWINGEEYKKGAPMACCMVYFGNNFSKFETIFSEAGKCIRLNN